MRSCTSRPTGLSANAVTTAVSRPKARLRPRATLYSPPPSETRKSRVVVIRPSPGSNRSMISPRATRSKRHSDLGLIFSVMRLLGSKSGKLLRHEIDQRLTAGRDRGAHGKTSQHPADLPGRGLTRGDGHELIVGLDLLVGVIGLDEDLDRTVARARASHRNVRKSPDEHERARGVGNDVCDPAAAHGGIPHTLGSDTSFGERGLVEPFVGADLLQRD